MFRPAALLLAAALAAGCAQQGPAPREEVFVATLSASQEVPPTTSAASGQAEVHYSERSQMIRWRVTFGGLSAPLNGAHLHGPAGPGQNAGIQVPLAVGSRAQVLEGQARLTPQQANELASGLWYVNIHTPTHPAGEIRGQLRIQR